MMCCIPEAQFKLRILFAVLGPSISTAQGHVQPMKLNLHKQAPTIYEVF